MRYATVNIPQGTFPEGDKAWRYQGARVKVLGPYKEKTKMPGDRPFMEVETEEGTTLIPKDWLE